MVQPIHTFTSRDDEREFFNHVNADSNGGNFAVLGASRIVYLDRVYHDDRPGEPLSVVSVLRFTDAEGSPVHTAFDLNGLRSEHLETERTEVYESLSDATERYLQLIREEASEYLHNSP